MLFFFENELKSVLQYMHTIAVSNLFQCFLKMQLLKEFSVLLQTNFKITPKSTL